MKICIAAVMSAVAVFCLAMDAAACTAVLVGKDASTTGRVMLGHNEDDDPSLIVRHGYVPPRDWPADASLVDHPDCAKVPRGGSSFGFFWTEVRDAKCGAGSAESTTEMPPAASSASSCPSQLSAELRVNQTADRTVGEACGDRCVVL